MWNTNLLPFRSTWFTRVPHVERTLFTIPEHLIYTGAAYGTQTFYHSGAPDLHGCHMWNTNFLPFRSTWFKWVPHVEHTLFTIPEHLIYTDDTCGTHPFYHSGEPDLHGCHMWNTNFLPFRSTWFTRVPHVEHKLFTIPEHLIYTGATCGAQTFYHSGAPDFTPGLGCTNIN
jgi:hypothetical protein